MTDLCRLCSNQKSIGLMNNINDVDVLLEYKLNKCFKLKLADDKLLPQNVCNECLEMLDKCSKFHDSIQETQQKLEEKLQQLNVSNTVFLEDIKIEQDECEEYQPPKRKSLRRNPVKKVIKCH